MARVLTLLLVALVALPSARVHAAARSAGAPDEMAELIEQYDILRQSLEAMREVSPEDRPATVAFAGRVHAYAAAHPDDPRPLALELQVRIWLEDDAQVAALYERLMALQPDSAELAISALEHTLGDDAGDVEARIAALHDLLDRYHGDVRISVELARLLAHEIRYEEAVTVLERAPIDPAADPDAVLLLAQCQFRANRFQAAIDTVSSIPDDAAFVELQGRTTAAQLKLDATESLVAWNEEQALRSADAARDDNPLVQIMTGKGRIVVELFEDAAPNTVANFIALTRQGFYDGTRFHRWVENFMVQGGDPLSRPDAEGLAGTGGPGYKIPDEYQLDGARKNFDDSLSMANRGAPNTAGSQFYLNHCRTPNLDGRYTVFGRVVEGLDVAHALRKDDELISMTVIRTRDHDYEPSKLPD